MEAILNGYSVETFNQQFPGVCPRVILAQGLRPKHGYDKETRKATDEIVAQELDFYFVPRGIQKVKFPANFKLPSKVEDMAEVTLINPTACIVHNFVYVKADGFDVKQEVIK